jgi:hypothetical protein
MRFTFRKLRTLRSGLDHLQRLAQIVRGPCWMYLASLTKRIVLGCASQGSSTSLAPSPFFGRPEGDGCAGGRHRGHKEKYADNQSFCHEAVTDRRSSAYWPPRRDYAHNDRPSMARRSDLIGGRCLKCTNSRQRKMLAKRTRLNFVIGEVSRLPFERRIAPCRDDRMKSPTSLHLKSRGSSPAFTAAFKQPASES